jgi:hypothetical protein
MTHPLKTEGGESGANRNFGNKINIGSEPIKNKIKVQNKIQGPQSIFAVRKSKFKSA